MELLKELLTKQRYPALLLAVGLICVFLANYVVSGNLSRPQIQPQRPAVTLLILGILCVTGSALLFLFDEDAIAYRRGYKITETGSGFETKLGDGKLCVEFGLFQRIYEPGDRTAVAVLPANEFFDERCFDDERTVAGAFIRQHFSAQEASSVRDLVESELQGRHFELVECKPGKVRKSYGVGTSVYLAHPLGRPCRIIFAAVATDRPPLGLKTDLGTIFKVIEQVKAILAFERLSVLFIPLLGAGKGGVPPEIAFQLLVTSLIDAKLSEGGHHLKETHVVVYQPEGKEPQVPRHRAQREVRRLASLFREASN